MCLIIVKPENCKFNQDILKIAWDMNAHGGGFMAHNPENNTLIVKKGFFDKHDFIDEILKYENQRIVVHFRYATHGNKDISNCHPFRISSDLAVVHNGQLFDIKIINKKFSDTWHFAQICKGFYKHNSTFWKNPRFKKQTEHKIGKNNKLVWMDNTGQIEIYNENEGQYLDGIWYSNCRFLFGTWKGMNEYYEREYVRKMGKLVKPYKLSFWCINEGENWYFCDSCCHIFNKESHGEPNIVKEEYYFYEEIYLCDKCNNEYAWMLKAEFRYKPEILDGYDVSRVYREEMTRIQEEYKEKEKLRKEKEEAEKLNKEIERISNEVDTQICSTL